MVVLGLGQEYLDLILDKGRRSTGEAIVLRPLLLGLDGAFV